MTEYFLGLALVVVASCDLMKYFLPKISRYFLDPVFCHVQMTVSKLSLYTIIQIGEDL